MPSPGFVLRVTMIDGTDHCNHVIFCRGLLAPAGGIHCVGEGCFLRNEVRKITPIPMVREESATLNAGQ